MRRLDGKFHVDGDQIVKTSSGEVIPEDEPLFLFRGRDRLALLALGFYRQLCIDDGCTEYQLEGIDALIREFEAYASNPNRMKQPGITRGAPWLGPQ